MQFTTHKYDDRDSVYYIDGRRVSKRAYVEQERAAEAAGLQYNSSSTSQAESRDGVLHWVFRHSYS
jgi:hypothetical protein